jgi:hypothetical protein
LGGLPILLFSMTILYGKKVSAQALRSLLFFRTISGGEKPGETLQGFAGQLKPTEADSSLTPES